MLGLEINDIYDSIYESYLLRVKLYFHVYLSFVKVVGQILHGIRPDAGNVFILAFVLRAESGNTIYHVVGNFDPNFETQHQC